MTRGSLDRLVKKLKRWALRSGSIRHALKGGDEVRKKIIDGIRASREVIFAIA